MLEYFGKSTLNLETVCIKTWKCVDIFISCTPLFGNLRLCI